MSENPRSALEHIRNKVGPRVQKRAALLSELELLHIRTEYDDRLDEEIELILSHIIGGNASEGYALFVTGMPGAGKSTIVRRRLEANPALEPYVDAYGNEKQIWLRVSTPAGCTMKDLGIRILRAAGYPMVKPPSETEVWNLVRETLRRKEYHIIFFDEFQHVLKAPTQKGALTQPIQ
jgi:predicted ATP-dependent serine protease